MAAGMQFDASQFGQRAIGNVHQPAGNAASQYSFQCVSHRRRSFARADDLNSIEGGSAEAFAANTHGLAVEIEMLLYGAFGIRGFKRGAKDLERVASEPGHIAARDSLTVGRLPASTSLRRSE
jgi:hypothetical protein